MTSLATWSTTVVPILATVVTAVATVMLWRVTAVLAAETRRLVEINEQPHVIATIEHNRWAYHFADLHLVNAGNATAFDISVSSEPPFELDAEAGASETPLQEVSILKPGQGLSSYLARFADLKADEYRVTIEWARKPSGPRESLTYSIRNSDRKGVSRLGSGDPLTAMASDLRTLREDFRKIVSGNSKPRVDVFTSADRIEERARWARARAGPTESRTAAIKKRMKSLLLFRKKKSD